MPPAEATVIRLQPERELPPFPTAPFTQVRVDRWERARTNTRWGDLAASTLTSVMNRAAEGDVADWVDLIEFAISTDPDLLSLYETRISRVAQADFVIVPNQFGNPRYADLAAEFVNELMGRIEDWQQAQRDLLHAIAVGFSAGQNEWDRDRVSRTNVVRRIDFTHGHRFRYDEAWQLRLYDQGRKRSEGSIYGEPLDPRLWTIHYYRPIASYPGIGGVMRSCIYPWCFGRWIEKYWLGNAEKHGDPLVYATVPQNTPGNVRTKILADLERLASDHVGVVEEGVKVEAMAAAAATKSWEVYQAYLARRDAKLTLSWLGASDITTPGEHGSQAAVNARVSVAADPRMVTDGDLFAASLQRTLFKQMIALNGHKFGCPVEHVPLPTMRLKTADDEVKRDESDLREERKAEREGYTPEVGGGMTDAPAPKPSSAAAQPSVIPLQPPSTASMSYGDMLAIVKASSAGEIEPESALEMILAGGVDAERAQRMVGLSRGGTFGAPTSTAAVQTEPAVPKARAPASSPGQTTRTRQTSSRSRSPFAATLRKG